MGRRHYVQYALLLASLLVGGGRSQMSDSYYGDYGETDDPCPENPIDNGLRCKRYYNCTECALYASGCSCDAACHHYGDCCSDAPNAPSAAALPERLDGDSFECEQRTVNRQEKSPLSIINRCPADSSSEKQRRCTDSRELLVYGSKSRLIYRNKYCSDCHGESAYERLPFEVVCKREPTNVTRAEILHQLLSGGVYYGTDDTPLCHLSYTAMDENHRLTYHRCQMNVVTSCPDGSAAEEREGCENGPMSVVYEETSSGLTKLPPYRNARCAECNGVRRHSCTPPIDYHSGGVLLRGFETLVSVDDSLTECAASGKTVEEIQECAACPDGTTYRPLGGCVALFSDPAVECTSWIKVRENYTLANDSIVLHEQNLTKSEFKIHDGIAYVCDDAVIESRLGPSAIVTTVLISLSLVGLLLQLLIYATFKQLRNLPGLIVVCISGALFAALLLFLVGLYTDPAARPSGCVALSVLTYFSFMASFFWTNVMAFDVTRMLTSTMHAQGKRRRLIVYNLYAWLCPLTLSVAALLADRYRAPVSPRFGTRQCWINDSNGLLCFFLGPLAVLLAINVALYVAAIVAIARAARQTRMVNPDVKERVFLAIRLVVVMGLPWIFVLPARYSTHPAWDYVFTALNASQGIFIFVCFVCSKTVLQILRKKTILRSPTSAASRRTLLSSIRMSLGARTSGTGKLRHEQLPPSSKHDTSTADSAQRH